MLNTYTQYQKDTTENTWTHMEGGGYGKLNTHRDYRGQARQAMAAGHQFDELVVSPPSSYIEIIERAFIV